MIVLALIAIERINYRRREGALSLAIAVPGDCCS